MLLDCSTFDTTLTSICMIFNVQEEKLLKVLSEFVNDEDKDIEELLDDIYSYVVNQIGLPTDVFDVLWFHGTRVEDTSVFYNHGILPKNKVYESLYSRLTLLAANLEKVGENPFSSSIMGKTCINDEGPFAVLIKCIAINASGSNHNYTKVPELVEDIAGILLGKNYRQLVKIFQKITVPSVVSFTANPTGDELSRALFFLKLLKDGKNELEAAEFVNTCFNARGNCVIASRIKNVEKVYHEAI